MHSLIVALNPSIDCEWQVDRVIWEEKNTIREERRWAGGKGVNVARWLRHLGGKPELLIPFGGDTGSELTGYLRSEKISSQMVRIKEPSRVNVIVSSAGGGQMRFNPMGPELSTSEWRKIVAKARRNIRGAACLVLSGSLPRGLAPEAYAELIKLGNEAGAKTILDCDGKAFELGVQERPFLVKPNEHELSQWAGRKLTSSSAVRKAANELSTVTGGWVMVSRGAKGALLAGKGIVLEARPGRGRVVNTVGAGDALLAAVVRQIELGSKPIEWLKAGVRVGTRATRCAAGKLPE